MMNNTAFSSCPNDIFLFRSFLIKESGFNFFNQVTITNIDFLNKIALEKPFSIIKVSAALFPFITDHYVLSQVGNTLGNSIGPLLLAKTSDSYPYKIACPGKNTTAHALAKLFYPESDYVFLPYDKIMEAIQNDLVDAGVVIHESRFNFAPLACIADLGQLWSSTTSFPLPLGCIAISKNFTSMDRKAIEILLQQSLLNSLNNKHDAAKFSLSYAKEKSMDIILRFVDTYVNNESISLSKSGRKAFSILWDKITQ